MKQLMILSLASALLCPAVLSAETETKAEEKPPVSKADELRKKIEGAEKEAGKPSETPVAEGDKREGEKPLEMVNAEKLVQEILGQMEDAKTGMKKSGTKETASIQESILDNVGKLHSNIIGDINKLIDIAKQMETKKQQEQKDSQDPKKDEKKDGQGSGTPQGGSQSSNQAGSPATAPYTPSGTAGDEDVKRTADDATKWGVLPDKKRDAVQKAKNAPKLDKYSKQVSEYLEKINEKNGQ